MTAEPQPPVTTTTLVAPRRRFNAGTLRDVGIVLVPVILFVALSLSTDTFLTVDNLRNVLNRSVALGLIAAAGTLVIIAGGFDLSAAAIFAVSAIVGAFVTNGIGGDWGVVLGILLGLLTGCVLGLVNGLIVSVGRVDHIVGTLGTMIAYGGIAIAISGSGVILITVPQFAVFATTPFLGIPLSSWYFIVFLVLCALALKFTVLGQRIFAVGGNASAARLSGIPVHGTIITVYVLSGFAAALAGLLTAASSLSTRATSGAGLVFEAFAAILIGGTSIRGGRGAMWRTVVGIATLVLVANGFNLLGVDPVYQQIVTGGIILVAVIVDVWTRRRAR